MAKHPFSVEKAEDSPGLALWQTTMLWQRQIRKTLEPHGITHPEFVLLATLLWLETHNTDTQQAALINQTKLDKMTISKALKKLSTLGLTTRSEDAGDARAKTARLTDRGRTLATTLIPLVESTDRKFFAKAPPKERLSLLTALRTIIKASD